MKIVVAITGASGAEIAVTLLQNLRGHDVSLILSRNAVKILRYETGLSVAELKKNVTRVYDNEEMEVDIASGTNKFDALVIVPCSTSTLAKIACGIADNLITRVAAVALKERRKIILVPRETPLSAITLKNMYTLAQLGVVILPPVPAFYLKPGNMQDVIRYIAGKILDILEIPHTLYSPYSPKNK